MDGTARTAPGGERSYERRPSDTILHPQKRRQAPRQMLSTRHLLGPPGQTTSMKELVDILHVKQDQHNAEAAPWYILRPTSKVITRWDAVTSLALIFTAIVTPFEVTPRPPTHPPLPSPPSLQPLASCHTDT